MKKDTGSKIEKIIEYPILAPYDTKDILTFIKNDNCENHFPDETKKQPANNKSPLNTLTDNLENIEKFLTNEKKDLNKTAEKDVKNIVKKLERIEFLSKTLLELNKYKKLIKKLKDGKINHALVLHLADPHNKLSEVLKTYEEKNSKASSKESALLEAVKKSSLALRSSLPNQFAKEKISFFLNFLELVKKIKACEAKICEKKDGSKLSISEKTAALKELRQSLFPEEISLNRMNFNQPQHYTNAYGAYLTLFLIIWSCKENFLQKNIFGNKYDDEWVSLMHCFYTVLDIPESIIDLPGFARFELPLKELKIFPHQREDLKVIQAKPKDNETQNTFLIHNETKHGDIKNYRNLQDLQKKYIDKLIDYIYHRSKRNRVTNLKVSTIFNPLYSKNSILKNAVAGENTDFLKNIAEGLSKDKIKNALEIIKNIHGITMDKKSNDPFTQQLSTAINSELDKGISKNQNTETTHNKTYCYGFSSELKRILEQAQQEVANFTSDNTPLTTPKN